jgi:hypothetical protein
MEINHNVLIPDILNVSMQYLTCILIIIYRTVNQPKNMSLILKKFGSLCDSFHSAHIRL